VTALIVAGWFFHPMRNGDGYNFWSGIAGSFLTAIPGWAVAVFIYIKAFNCRQPGCLRVGPHHHAPSGTRWCGHHMPDDMRNAHPKPHLLKPKH
jgi:hypothetical protein